MAEFKGFSEISLHYADNFHLVEAMKKMFDEQCSTLFAALEDKVMKAPWFDSQRMNITRGNYYLDVHVASEEGAKVCVLHIYLGPRDVSSTYSDTGSEPPRVYRRLGCLSPSVVSWPSFPQ